MLHNKTCPCSKPKQACPAALSDNSKRCTLNSQCVHISFTVTFLHYHRTKIKLAANNVVTKKMAYRGIRKQQFRAVNYKCLMIRRYFYAELILAGSLPANRSIYIFFQSVPILLTFNAALNNHKHFCPISYIPSYTLGIRLHVGSLKQALPFFLLQTFCFLHHGKWW